MPIDPALVGRKYPPCPAHLVTPEDVSAFAASLGAHSETVPLTYAIKVAQPALAQFFGDPEMGVALDRTMHADQSFEYARPIQVGDRLVAQLEVTRIRPRGASDWVSVEFGVDGDDGRVVTGRATFIVAHAAGEEA